MLYKLSTTRASGGQRLERGAGPDYRPTVRVSSRRVDSTVEIRVYDNGVGMVPAVLEKVFTPFFTTNPAGKGTGLGLSLSYDIIVHEHGGSFDVATEPGEYAEFIIRLPCAPPQEYGVVQTGG